MLMDNKPRLSYAYANITTCQAVEHKILKHMLKSGAANGKRQQTEQQH